VDEAARRVKPRNLSKAVRLRNQREKRALMDLSSALANRDVAERASAHCRQELSAQEKLRRAVETRAYGSLAAAGPMPLSALTRHLAAVETVTDSVRRASKNLEDAELRKAQADQAANEARSFYATRAHDARKWAKLAEFVTTSWRKRSERFAEIAAEDEARRCPPRIARSAVR
jgi:hypothetical protein